MKTDFQEACEWGEAWFPLALNGAKHTATAGLGLLLWPPCEYIWLVLVHSKGMLYPPTRAEGAYVQRVPNFRNLGVPVRDITNVPSTFY